MSNNSRLSSSLGKFVVAIVFVLALILPPAVVSKAPPTKNVILMISDGQGFNTVRATDCYVGGPAVYETFPVAMAVSTYSASNNASDNPLGYDPSRAWSDFDYVRANSTDSSSAATALNTGVKTDDGRVNWSTAGRPMLTFAQVADTLGKSAGAITSVEFSHATPAGVAAHNISRNNYSAIAHEMIYSSGLDVIIGAGHPMYDNNGRPIDADYQFVGGEATWNDIIDADGANGFTFIQSKADFAAIADGRRIAPGKLLGVPQVRTTLQQARSGGDARQVQPGTFNTNVPTLATMSRAGLNVLSRNRNGFYLMIEGGAIDWANHANQIGRMIEEEMDFNDAVQAVVDWVDQPGDDNTWDNTLLIVTADHETGYLWGPGSGKPSTFNPIVDNGAGSVPDVQYNSGGHTNSLVPLYAKGAGSEKFAQCVKGIDPVRGPYIDNTDVFRVMNNAAPEQANPICLAILAAAIPIGLVFCFRTRS